MVNLHIFGMYDWKAGEEWFQKAIAFNSNLAVAPASY
jgi:hypothetical protein